MPEKFALPDWVRGRGCNPSAPSLYAYA